MSLNDLHTVRTLRSIDENQRVENRPKIFKTIRGNEYFANLTA